MSDTPAARAARAATSHRRPSLAAERRAAETAEGTAVAHLVTGMLMGGLLRPESPLPVDVSNPEPMSTGPGGVFDVTTASGIVLRVAVTYLRTKAAR